MYKSFRVKNFRCFKDLQINDLGRVNLIAGKNNTGKTALLEAMYLLTRPLSPLMLFQIQTSRGIDVPKGDYNIYWKQFFREMNAKETIEISASGGEQDLDRKLFIRELQASSENAHDFHAYHKRRNRSNTIVEVLDMADEQETILKLSLQLDEPWPNSTDVYFAHDLLNESVKYYDVESRFVPVLYRIDDVHVADWYSQLVVEGEHEDLRMQLAKIESRLDSLAVLSPWGKQMLWAEIDGTLMPLRVLGEGTNRLCHFLMTMKSAKPRCLFIDEIENGIHYSVQKKIWEAIGKAARELDIQVFATTHSYEMIQAAHEAFKDDDPYEFRFHRLDRNTETGEIEAVTYNKAGVNAFASLSYEVRG